MPRSSFLALIAFFLILSASHAYADGLGGLLSPGQLAKAHAKYEGLSSCTLCHRVGGGVPDSKCLDCHDKLAKRIEKKEGVHARFTDACITCHLDHMGRDHSLITLHEKDFKHDLTGYPLEGKHAEIECSKCHKQQGLYTGLVRECVSCHKDNHSKQLGTTCEKCHESSSWKTITKFKHDKETKFLLKGAHLKTDCKKCHASNRFKQIDSSGCGTTDCHGDKHKGQFGKKECTECHDRDSASWMVRSFDHDIASFALKGKHLKVDCKKCHVSGKFKPLEHKGCSSADCHADNHKGQFGKKECIECHDREIGPWAVTRAFDHNNAAFALKGKHSKVDCKKCHVNGRYKPLEHKTCSSADCHPDKHEGSLKPKLCAQCHREDASTWAIKETFAHSKDTDYALTGKHRDVKCEKCHENRKYKPVEHKTCDACHEDKHKGQFRNKTCTACHDRSSATWDTSKTFDHNRESSFALTAKHAQAKCDKCHKDGVFRLRYTTCNACHDNKDPHSKGLGTQCEKCHVAEAWDKLIFDHNKDTKFPLTHEHERVAQRCEKCHKNKKYHDTPTRCVGCHRMM